jgi:hypothetical protein
MRFFGALEHLGTLPNALVPGNAPLLFAPYTLMRTALEAAGYAAWAWEPGLPPVVSGCLMSSSMSWRSKPG